jgi:flagellar protein FliL
MAGEEKSAEDAVESASGMKRALVAGGAAAILVTLGIFAGPMVRNVVSGPAPEVQAAEAETGAADKAALYTSLHPPLVVNFKDSFGDSHYMQITMEVMARDQKVIDAVKNHTPVIRNALILLYGAVDYDAVTTRAGKEEMLAQGLREIQDVMTEQTGSAGVEAVYFTNLIIQ